MIKIDLDFIAQLAHEASPGPWRPTDQTHGHWGVTARPPGEYDGCEIVHAHSDTTGYGNGSSEANARFIAALSPEVVLALVDAAAAWLGHQSGETERELGWWRNFQAHLEPDPEPPRPGTPLIGRCYKVIEVRPEPKAPTGLTGDDYRPWWVLDRTGASKPKGVWSKALADSTVTALGDPVRYVVAQADPEG